MKLLVYDDNTDLLDAIQLTLEYYNCDVKGTTSQKHFYYLIDSFKPDAILMDVDLGDEDGRVVCRALRNDYHYDNIPIVLFSGKRDNLSDYIHYGADSILQKPCEIKQLIPTLMFAIKERKSILNQRMSSLDKKELPNVIFK